MSRFQRSKANQSPVLFTPDSVVGLLTVGVSANGASYNGSANVYPHNTLSSSYPFQASFHCYGSTANSSMESDIRSFKPYAGLSRSPIVGSKLKNDLGFNFDSNSLGHSYYYTHVEFALTVFLKNISSSSKTKSASCSTTGTAACQVYLNTLRPNSLVKGGVTSCSTGSIASGSNSTSGNFTIQSGERMALVFSGFAQNGQQRNDSASNQVGYQNSFVASLNNLSSLIDNDVVIDHELTALAMTRTFERDFMLWNL